MCVSFPGRGLNLAPVLLVQVLLVQVLLVSSVLASGLLGACAPAIPVDAGPPADDDAGVPVVDETAVYMDDETFMEVDITLDAADFDTLRRQERNYFTTLGPGCLDRNFTSPFTYFSADVRIRGIPDTEELAFENVGLRKKGFFGSVVPDKPSLKIRFNKYVDGQRLFGEKRMTLNNQNQDDSLVRTCLAYRVFRDAGVPAPRCNFAVVHVNDERLGVYVNVDAIKKPMLRREFGDDDGNLYEGSLSDFRPEWAGTFEKKTNESDPATPEIDALVSALQRADTELMGALDDVLDLDAFYTFWAVETLVSHWDGYSGNTNNFFLYGDPTTNKIAFLPWGTDGAFQGPYLLFEDMLAPDSVMASGLLTRRLYGHPEGRASYLARLDELLQTVWNEDGLDAEIDRQRALFFNSLLISEQNEVDAAIDEVRDFVAVRRDLIETEISQGPIEWDVPLRESICLPDVGSADFTFSTTWGTHPAPAFAYTDLGTATVNATVDDAVLVPTATGSGAGVEQNGNLAGWTVILATADLDGAPTKYFYFIVDPALISPGAVIDIDGNQAAGYLFVVAPQFAVEAGFYEGTLTLDATSTVDGEPVSGSFSGRLTAGGG